MTSNELADEVEQLIGFCRSGILGVGQEQYAEHRDGVQVQRFESLPLSELIQYAREEVRDLINYCVMLDIRFRRMQQAVDATTQATVETTGQVPND